MTKHFFLYSSFLSFSSNEVRVSDSWLPSYGELKKSGDVFFFSKKREEALVIRTRTKVGLHTMCTAALEMLQNFIPDKNT